MGLKSIKHEYEYKGKYYSDLLSVVTSCGAEVIVYKVIDVKNTVSKETIYKLDKRYFRIVRYVATTCPCREISLDCGHDGYFSTEKKAKKFLIDRLNQRIKQYESDIQKIKKDIALITL